MTTAIADQNDRFFLPGRLGNPDQVMKTDSRTDPRLVAACVPFKLDVALPPIPVNADSPLPEKLEFCSGSEAGMATVFTALCADLPAIPNIERRTGVIKGVDGNGIKLYIHTPRDASGPLPCVYHMHGGGMVILTADDPSYRRWRR